MSESKFTSGPWYVSGDVDRYVNGPDQGYDGEYLNHADANLIAAAPELYEALESLLNWSMQCNCIKDSLFNPCAAALAKARGEK